MSALEIHKKEKFRPLIWNAPSYYDRPDGEDLMGKLSFVVKNTTTLATLAGVLYTRKHPKVNAMGKIIRIAKFTLPGAAMGFTFTCVTYCSTVLRGKDDALNHTLGAVAAGLLLGPASGVPAFSSVGALLLGFTACLNKNLNMMGYDIGGKTYKRYYSTYFKRVLNFSALPEIKGNWTRDP